MTAATSKKAPSKNGTASTNGARKRTKAKDTGMTDVQVRAEPCYGNGAIFEWKCMLTDLDDGRRQRSRIAKVDARIMNAETLAYHEHHGHFGYYKTVDMGNGMFGLCSLRFDGEIDEYREMPDKEERALIKPIRDALFAFFEAREDVTHVEVGTSVNGWSRFEISIRDPDPDSCGDPELEMTLKRGSQ
jgi:hypothetical protein